MSDLLRRSTRSTKGQFRSDRFGFENPQVSRHPRTNLLKKRTAKSTSVSSAHSVDSITTIKKHDAEVSAAAELAKLDQDYEDKEQHLRAEVIDLDNELQSVSKLLESRQKDLSQVPAVDTDAVKKCEEDVSEIQERMQKLIAEMAKKKMSLEYAAKTVERRRGLLQKELNLKIALIDGERDSDCLFSDEEEDEQNKDVQGWTDQIPEDVGSSSQIRNVEDSHVQEENPEDIARHTEAEQTVLQIKEEQRQVQLQVDAQLAAAEARLEQLRQRETEATANVQRRQVHTPVSNPCSTSNIDELARVLSLAMGRITPSSRQSDNSRFLARQSTAKELPVFSGKPEEWPTFIASYRNSTEICGFSDAENISRLQKALKGDALRHVQCLMVAPDNFPTVMRKLQSRFGDPEHIVEAMINKAKSLPVVEDDKPESLIEFGTAVENLAMTIQSLQCNDHLSNPQLLKDLTSKLPFQSRMQWMQWTESDPTRKRNLICFAEWLDQVTTLACRLCPPTIKSDDNQKKAKNSRSGETVFVASDVTSPTEQTQKKSTGEKKCSFCATPGHRVSQCKNFQEENLDTRWKWVKEKRHCFSCLNYGHAVKDCRSKKVCGKDNCEKVHHGLLHKKKETKDDSSVEVITHANAGALKRKFRVDLMVLPVTLQGPKGVIHTYAMLDTGSTTTMIDEEVSRKLGLKGVKEPLCFKGLHPPVNLANSSCVSLKIIAPDSKEKYQLENVHTMSNLPLPYQSVSPKDIQSWDHLKGIDLKTFERTQPKILIGQDNSALTLSREVIEGPPNAPVAARTKLGWALTGKIPNVYGTEHSFHVIEDYEDELHELVKYHFTTEAFGVKVQNKKPRSTEDKRAQEIMDQTTHRVNERWETGLLWKHDKFQLPESKSTAMRRLLSIEKKMDREESFSKQYCQKINDYVTKGYVRKLTHEESKIEGTSTWYLPHFGVVNPNKPGKFRLVFDAAAKSHGVSLNDMLLKGPDQLSPLPAVLCKFRQRVVGVTADIAEMFHQVVMRKEDLPAQRFLWRGTDRNRDPDVMEILVMMFGSACSPCCAQEVKNKNASEFKEEFPEAVQAIIRRHYVDDYLDSFDSVQIAEKCVSEVIEVHRRGGFIIRNWVSNSQDLQMTIPADMRAEGTKNMVLDQVPTERVLGLHRNPNADTFTFTTAFHKVKRDIVQGDRIPTKREALALIMSLFDPLGFFAHFTVKAKILLQDAWRTKIGWDDELPTSIHDNWKVWVEDLKDISQFRLPRCYSKNFSSADEIQLHIFVDASQLAFSSVAYFRISKDDSVDVAFISAKTRVAPLKSLSVPRLELQAALMGSGLGQWTKEEHDIQIDRTIFWSDSSTALAWIRSDSKQYHQFVSHRVGEIQELTNPVQWKWIPTKENVADEATRNSSKSDWGPESRWVNGPKFLKLSEEEWPKEPKRAVDLDENAHDDLMERKKEFVGVVSLARPIIDITRFSNWSRMIRSTAWLLRYINNCRNPSEKLNGELRLTEIRDSEVWWWRIVQRECFGAEIQEIVNQRDISKKSSLRQLSPFIDNHGILRVNGRLSSAGNVPEGMKQPVILPSKHHFTRLLLGSYHEMMGHHGQEQVVNEIRQCYWIPGLRGAVRSVVNHCQRCKNERAEPAAPQMGLIPNCRLTSYVRPFTTTGLDHFGPIEITVGRRHEKRYGALFTCMSIRAVHLEIASSLSTDSCLMAIRRFTARRGSPSDLYSDNGTNFKGANNELTAALKELDQDRIVAALGVKGVKWHFNPPSAPHMGGSWERLVRSVKTALKSTLKERFPREETLQTLFAEAEHVVNESPLTHVSYDPEEGFVPESNGELHNVCQIIFGKDGPENTCPHLPEEPNGTK